MNRKQEIAAWIFGLIIASALLLTANGIWALAVLAGLTILSLRDRQRKKQKNTVRADLSRASDLQETPTTPSLKSITPHLLATALLQRRAEGGTPFRMWRDSEVQIPAGAAEIIAIACEFYQIRIFLDLLKRRFGPGIAKLVETSFSSIVDGVDGLNMFSRVNEAISCARELGPSEDGPDNPQLRLDLQVADQYLKIYSDSDPSQSKAALRLPLAQCLGYARLSAEQIFSGLVPKIDFDPLSVVAVSRETEYKGITSRWSALPGCFERHLQRKEGNLLFPISDREPSDEAINEACTRDQEDLEKLKVDVSALGRSLREQLGQDTIDGGILVDFLRYRIDPLMHRAAAIGALANTQLEMLQELDKALIRSILNSRSDMKDNIEEIQKDRRDLHNLFFAQASREDTPIAGEDFILALLCESTDSVKHVTAIMSRADNAVEAQTPADVKEECKHAILMIINAAKQGFELPGAEEKLAVLRAYSGEVRSTATA